MDSHRAAARKKTCLASGNWSSWVVARRVIFNPGCCCAFNREPERTRKPVRALPTLICAASCRVNCLQTRPSLVLTMTYPCSPPSTDGESSEGCGRWISTPDSGEAGFFDCACGDGCAIRPRNAEKRSTDKANLPGRFFVDRIFTDIPPKLVYGICRLRNLFSKKTSWGSWIDLSGFELVGAEEAFLPEVPRSLQITPAWPWQIQPGHRPRPAEGFRVPVWLSVQSIGAAPPVVEILKWRRGQPRF